MSITLLALSAVPVDSRPTLYLSNWSSHRTPGAHGPGRKWTAMAEPRAWEWGAGRVRALTPELGDPDGMLRDALAERHAGVQDGPAMRAYRAYYIGGRIPGLMAPGALHAAAGGGMFPAVEDGDTVCCACAVAERAAGRCHLAWSAPFLHRAGWRVVLDGIEWIER